VNTLRDSPLQVVQYIATRRGDADRGPAIWMNEKEAISRLLLEGELVYVSGPKRSELATLQIDDDIKRGQVVVRDIAGLLVTDVIRVRKPDFDRARGPGMRV
jgi:hypothetical protein